MTKSDLLRVIAKDKPEWRARDVANAIDVFFDEISQRLVDGGRVELRGFGAFTTRRRKARTSHQPRTGLSVAIPAKRVPHFKASKEILGRLKIG